MFRKYLRQFLPYLIGFGASVGLLTLYMGLMTLTGDWYSAKFQFEEYRWWIIALSVGLGIQSTLFTFLKRGLKGTEKKAPKSTLAATGGITTGSMLVCCLHHISDIVPFLGLPIIAVTLQRYQTLFLFTGVLSSFVGILMMLCMLRKHGLIQAEGFSQFLTLKLRVITGSEVMIKRLSKWGFSNFFLTALLMVFVLSSGANAFEVQTSDKNMVRVAVKPIQLTAGEKAIFRVSLNTHSVDLIDDMAQASILQDNEGRVYKVLEWKGSSPGGHHRRGTLEFSELQGNPQSFKLIMKGIADVPERVFEWEIVRKDKE